MQEYALVSADGSTIIKYARKDPGAIYAKADLAPGKPYWLSVVRAQTPDYDPQSQVLEPEVTVIESAAVRKSRSVRDLTSQELLDRARRAIDAAAPDLLHLALLDIFNRMRVAEAKLAAMSSQLPPDFAEPKELTVDELKAEYLARQQAL